MRTLTISAIAMAGTLLLAGCGGDPAPQQRAAEAPAQGGTGGGAGALNTTIGTAKTSKAQPGTGDWAAPNGGNLRAVDVEKADNWVQLTAARAGALDPVLVNGAGLTLYRFDEDSADPPTATCNGECATTWPPVTVEADGKIFIAGVAEEKVGVVRRDDGRLQVTVGGWPVYRFAKDTEAGDTKGQGVKGTWFGITPDGGKAGEAEAPAEEDPAEQSAQTPAGSAKRVVLFGGRNFNVFDDAASSQVIEAGSAPDGGCVNAIDAKTASSIAFDGLVKVWDGPDCTGESQELGAVNAEFVGGIADLRDIDFDNRIASVKIG
ncbi:hypothetical protein [Actinoplanes sp. RD1]|uniref:hypothetical protein n=1 Tax=Actinoplanes sp. RD1 TaxID=3064538 RepID=UPI0027421DB4|nr:hypothetical protein [Actinoplanes sp. RD1]